MTTHADHDHPNTKAARAACRRGSVQSSPTDKAAKAAHRVKAGKPKACKVTTTDPALPHEFDAVIGKPTQCYVCGRAKRASVHDTEHDGPGRFVFDRSGKMIGLRLW